MGSMRAMDARDYLGLHAGLKFHLETNFYPPLPQYVIDDTSDAFIDYWNGVQELDQSMADRCYLKDVDALIHYHGSFLEE